MLHTAESTPDLSPPDEGAERVAAWISTRTDPGSYHRLVDSDSIVALVPWWYEAWHDGTGTNPHSVGISAATTAALWPAKPWSWTERCVVNMALAAADYAAWLESERGVAIPARRITSVHARARVPGFLSHGELDPGRRSDPGPGFPWDLFLAAYAWLRSPTPAPPPAPPPPNTDFGVFDMASAQTKLVPVGPLDGAGNGWTLIGFDSPVLRVVGVVANAAHPIGPDRTPGSPDDGYVPEHSKLAAAIEGGQVLLTVQGGAPGGLFAVWVTAA